MQIRPRHLSGINVRMAILVRGLYLEPTIPKPFGHWLSYTVKLPLRRKILSANLVIPPFAVDSTEPRLRLIVQSFGLEVIQHSFIACVGMTAYLPEVIPGPRDPENSEELQWSFWQGRLVHTSEKALVYDTTGMQLDWRSITSG